MIVLLVPAFPDVIALPQSMGGDIPLSVPMALLMNYDGEFDLLFANQMALLLANSLQNIKDVSITQKVEANAVFAKIPSNWVLNLQEK